MNKKYKMQKMFDDIECRHNVDVALRKWYLQFIDQNKMIDYLGCNQAFLKQSFNFLNLLNSAEKSDHEGCGKLKAMNLHIKPLKQGNTKSPHTFFLWTESSSKEWGLCLSTHKSLLLPHPTLLKFPHWKANKKHKRRHNIKK